MLAVNAGMGNVHGFAVTESVEEDDETKIQHGQRDPTPEVIRGPRTLVQGVTDEWPSTSALGAVGRTAFADRRAWTGGRFRG